ncbi:MAG TPA: hypothetical protein VFZ77_20200 [Acidimicrobiales bacterium]
MADIERRTLTSDEVALVLRRAAEIETAADGLDGSPVAGYEPAAIEEAASEVGLSRSAVRQAVAELRAGALATEPDRRRARTATSRCVAQQRLVDHPPGEVHAAVDRFLRTQMFEQRRHSGDRSVYRPRSDLVASLRRGLDFAGVIKLEGLNTVDVIATPAGDRTLVRLEAELSMSRAGALAGGAAAGSAVAVATGLAGAILTEPALLVAALPAGAAIGGGGMRVAESRWRRRRDDVGEVLASVLDRL